MASITNLRPVGDRIKATYTDGTIRWFFPTGSGVYLPGSHTPAPAVPQGAGETGSGNSGSANPTPPGSVVAATDDYPWKTAPVEDMSPLRYSYRDCTDFVAWRINRDAGVTHSPWKWTWGNLRLTNGDAIGWKHDWDLHGWHTDVTPAAGVIGWLGTSAGAYGHVYYVQSVTSSTMVVEEYNWGGTQAYNTRTVPIPSIDSSHSFLAMPPS
jgi:surface antigen